MTGQELKRLRQSLHLSQEEFAKQLRTRRETVVRYESGRYPIPARVELAITHLIAAKRVRLVGSIAAGAPLAYVLEAEMIEMPSWMIRDGEYLALRVKGNAMWEEGILPGDLVVVKRQPYAGNGQTVVALVSGEASIKKYYRWPNRVELRSANDAVEPLLVAHEDDVRIEGVVVCVIRDLRPPKERTSRSRSFP